MSPPLRRPLGTSATRMTQAPFVLLELETQEGVTGRAHAFCYLETAVPMLRRVVAMAAEALAGVSVEPAAIAARLHAQYRLLGVHGVVAMGVSAIDVACWDALARAADMPLARYLGARATSIPAYNSNGLSIAAVETLGAEAAALLEPGFDAIKIRLGRADPDADLAAVDAVRAAIPAGTTLMADYNQALNVDEVLVRAPAIDEKVLHWIEEPIAADDHGGCATLAAGLKTPVQIGENLHGPRAVASAIALRASDYLMFDLMRIGGVSGWLEAASLAAAARIPVSSHLYPEVSVHLLAATPTAHWLEYVDWAEPFLAEPATLTGGAVRVPDRPGTGIAWDEDAVARYAMR